MAIPTPRLSDLLDSAMSINLCCDYIDRAEKLTPEQENLLEEIEDGAEKVLDVILELYPELGGKMGHPEVNFLNIKRLQGAYDNLRNEVIALVGIARRTNDFVNAVALESILLAMIVPCKKEKK